jgi:hypothetical protein
MAMKYANWSNSQILEAYLWIPQQLEMYCLQK